MRILKSRWLALSMVLLGGAVSAEVTQRVELHLVPNSNPTSAYAMDVVTTIATDDGDDAKFERFTMEVWAFDPVKEFSLVGVPVNSRQVPAERLGVILGQGSLMVQQLAPGEAGETFGLNVGDEFLRVNGRSITSVSELRSSWQQSGDGETEVIVRRDGKEEVLRGKKPTVELLQVDPKLLLR